MVVEGGVFCRKLDLASPKVVWRLEKSLGLLLGFGSRVLKARAGCEGRGIESGESKRRRKTLSTHTLPPQSKDPILSRKAGPIPEVNER